jgi:hypothetical protein
MTLDRLLPGLVLAAGCSPAAPPPAPPPAVVIVLVDSLRPDHLGLFGASPSPTPALDACLGSGTRFPSARAPSSATVPSVHSLLAADRPGRFQAADHLAHRVTSAGAEAHLLASNLFLTDAFGMGQGWTSAAHHELTAAEDQVDRALARLASRPAPQLLVVQLSDLLLPNPADGLPPPTERLAGDPPELVLWQRLEAEPLLETEAAHLQAAYDQTLSQVDAALGRLCGALAPTDTLVLTAPHGEALGENGQVGHGFDLSEVLLRVPLAVRGPGWDNRENNVLVDISDVGATAAALLGGAPGPGTGRDLRTATGPSWVDRPLLLGPTVYGPARVGLVAGERKWVMGFGETRAVDLSLDPTEQQPTLTKDWPGAARALWHDTTGTTTQRVLRVALQPVGPRSEPLTWKGPSALTVTHPAGIVDVWTPPLPIHVAAVALEATASSVTVRPTTGRLPRELYVKLAQPAALDGLRLSVEHGTQTSTAAYAPGPQRARGGEVLLTVGPEAAPVTAGLTWVPAREVVP